MRSISNRVWSVAGRVVDGERVEHSRVEWEKHRATIFG